MEEMVLTPHRRCFRIASPRALIDVSTRFTRDNSGHIALISAALLVAGAHQTARRSCTLRFDGHRRFIDLQTQGLRPRTPPHPAALPPPSLAAAPLRTRSQR